ncbi:hypothetical protein FALBO_13301 [Fusarium albosuccineum]|uniref:Uncharacterized protein n=1 Tax=Fusarium albosuccineum TaxID=1237068 RepID=A0A8H4L0A1_9HYPO|nr:hypothetical protein FALBO_13301 [Fusarium albosuccineum]
MKITSPLSLLLLAVIPAMADMCKYPNNWWCGSDGHERYACENGVAVKKDECRDSKGNQLPCNELPGGGGAWCGGGI